MPAQLHPEAIIAAWRGAGNLGPLEKIVRERGGPPGAGLPERSSKWPSPAWLERGHSFPGTAQTRLSASRHRLSWCGEELNERAIELVRRLFVRQMADAWERDQPDVAEIPPERLGR